MLNNICFVAFINDHRHSAKVQQTVIVSTQGYIVKHIKMLKKIWETNNYTVLMRVPIVKHK